SEANPKGAQLPEHRLASLPLRELDGPQPVAYPFVQRSPEALGLRQPEVALPPQQVSSQPFHHLLHAASTRATRQGSDTLLERSDSFGRQTAINSLSEID